jgi:uncharacterized membrane protein YedE/YeeE
MKIVSAFAAGLVFGIGLILSGMTDPAKVIGFLDVTGTWDPSLAFVMAGAIAVAFFAFARALQLPERRDIDARLVGGSVVFGIGWGLAGFCPGPAIVAFGGGFDKATVFLIAMLAGMLLYVGAQRLSTAEKPPCSSVSPSGPSSPSSPAS